MKAVRLEKPGKAVVVSLPEPRPEEGKLLLRVRMIGLCGSDLSSYRGKNPLVQYPRIPGHEISATIVASIGDFSGLEPGVNVTVSPYTNCGRCSSCLQSRPNACASNQTLGVQRDGGLTAYITVPPDRVYPSANLSLKELCIVEPLTVGFHAVARGRVTERDIVAVLGCGGVGLGAIAAAHFRGAKTIAVDVDTHKLEIARQAGATHTVDTGKESLHEKFLELTGGLGPNVIIEAVGLPETFRAAVEYVAFAGRVVYIGYAKEPVAYETRLFVQKELDILGSRNALPQDFRQVIRMLELGKFPVENAVGTVVSLEEVPSTLQAWSANPAKFTKIMVRLDEGR